MLGDWCSTSLSKYFSYIVDVSFIMGKPENPQKTADLPQVTDKLYHTMLYRVHLAMSGIQTQNTSNLCYKCTYLSNVFNFKIRLVKRKDDDLSSNYFCNVLHATILLDSPGEMRYHIIKWLYFAVILQFC